jgi:hypothetical protein
MGLLGETEVGLVVCDPDVEEDEKEEEEEDAEEDSAGTNKTSVLFERERPLYDNMKDLYVKMRKCNQTH